MEIVETNAVSRWVRVHPLATILLLAAVVRVVLMPLLVYDFDIYHWALIMENIQNGDGLYDVAGYYYTPVWGYILGFMTGLLDLFGGVADFGARYTEFLPVEDLNIRFHIATITSLEFNIMMKAMLVVCDFLVAALIYRFMVETTSDARKATFAVAIWLFCLPVIYMSAIQAQFDTISALFMLLTVYLLYKDHAFVAGMMFSCTVLLKFFPGFTILVLLAYIWLKHRDDGRAVRMIVEAAVGAAIMFFVIYAPQIIDGNFLDSLSFIFGRVETTNALISYVRIAIMLFGTLISGYAMVKFEGDLNRRFLLCCMVALTFVVLPSTSPQYPIVMVPLLAMIIAYGDRGYFRPYVIMAVGAVANALAINNFSLLLSLSEYSSLISPEWVVSAMQGMESIMIFGLTSVELLTCIGGTVQAVGTAFILLMFFKDPIVDRFPCTDRLVRWVGGADVQR